MTDDAANAAETALDPAHGDDHEHDADGNVVELETGAAADASEPEGTEPPVAESSAPDPRPDLEPGDASLLALVDRLGALLDRSELSELAVEAGRTRLVLRKPVALPTIVAGAAAALPGDEASAAAGAAAAGAPAGAAGSGGSSAAPVEAPAKPSVKAPLTGVWYSSPAPGSAPFVAAGREVAVGQVIGLIEAMKLFNEIKSDLAGRVVRVIPDSGALVKAKQPLIEVEPL